MSLLAEILSGVVFVLSSGGFFAVRFGNNGFLRFLVGALAIASSVFLIYDHWDYVEFLRARLLPQALEAGQFRDCDGVCPIMTSIPAGSFTMGSAENETGRFANEGPQHSVTIGYRIALGVYDVTFDEWDACVADGGCNGYSPSDEGWGRGNRPVINVSWTDAQAYVDWLSRKTSKRYRLLTESEWEYAARAGTTTAYYWSDDLSAGHGNCIGCGSRWDGRETSPVGSFAPNAFGLYDMLGNAWQWTLDCYNESYAGAPSDGSAWMSGNCARHMLRGGSWNSEARYERSAYRGRNYTDKRVNDFGFRVAREL